LIVAGEVVAADELLVVVAELVNGDVKSVDGLVVVYLLPSPGIVGVLFGLDPVVLVVCEEVDTFVLIPVVLGPEGLTLVIEEKTKGETWKYEGVNPGGVTSVRVNVVDEVVPVGDIPGAAAASVKDCSTTS